jgi:hypothetical protein
MKTPMELDYIDDDKDEIEVQTYIETCAYKDGDLFDVVISKNVLFDDGYEEAFLLKYAKGLKNLDEVEDLCDEVILADREE